MNSELELLKAQLDEKNRDITNSKNSRKSFECEKTRAMQQIVLYRKQLQQCSSEISKVRYFCSRLDIPIHIKKHFFFANIEGSGFNDRVRAPGS